MSRPQNYPSQPEHIWNIFYELTRIPRPSGKEEAVLNYIKELAKNNNSSWKEDKKGNLVVYVPASSDNKNSKPLLLQNHVDMVCDNTPDRKIDFETDPIDLKVEGEWLLADRTTLGADNGIGCAAALALMTDKSLSHPPLELLFTVEEETGLHGATALDTSLISAEKMLNLDTEDWGMIFVGCAGGFGVRMNGSLSSESVPANTNIFEVEIKGLRGGHSGIDIHLQQGNAIQLLATFISENNLRISHFDGGKAHNIIPRDAKAIVTSETLNFEEVQSLLNNYIDIIRNTLHPEDEKISGLIKKENTSAQLTEESSLKLLSLIHTLPHGAHKYDTEAESVLVSQSSNLAEVKLNSNELKILSSVRFFDPIDTKKIKQTYQLIASTHNLELNMESGYPSWKPVYKGEMLNLVIKKYKEIFGLDPEITAIHAGLECGVIKDKFPNLDIVSIGPNVRSAHTPRERIEIKTVESFWKLLIETVKSL
ncbi:MAG: beta-Ala-His dipeptidase [Bacteriovoracaceae bacterium]|nr:beta-Ala-His dipeptidase [Bacteriovoracaceae bacterium]